MTGRLSPNAQIRYATLATFTEKVHRAHSLVEQFAAAGSKGGEQYTMPLSRHFRQLKLQFMGAGLDRLSQLCGSMELAAKRGMSHPARARILREGVGSLKFQLELEQRSIVSEDQAEQRRAAQEAGKEQEQS